jgi:hypothetical protein
MIVSYKLPSSTRKITYGINCLITDTEKKHNRLRYLFVRTQNTYVERYFIGGYGGILLNGVRGGDRRRINGTIVSVGDQYSSTSIVQLEPTQHWAAINKITGDIRETFAVFTQLALDVGLKQEIVRVAVVK